MNQATLRFILATLQAADGELDSTGYSHRHHVRLEIRKAIEEIEASLKEAK